MTFATLRLTNRCFGAVAGAALFSVAVLIGLEARQATPSNPTDGLMFQQGKLSYRKKSTGVERGREYFWLTRNRDGSRTMRTLAMTDDSKFVRDVVYTLGRDQRPADVFIRLMVGEAVIGTGYFRTEGAQLHLVTDAAETGHSEQHVPVPPRFHITSHAVMLDGWPFWSYDKGKGGEQTVVVYNTSTRWNGTDGPLGRLDAVRLRLVGRESVMVPAGTFACDHYTLDSDSVKSPTSHIYVTGDDNLLVRYDWGEFDLEYVLEVLER